MGVYKYQHEWCGFDQQVFLDNVERDTVVIPCYRCGRDITARKVNDKSIKLGEADGQKGILRHDKKPNNKRRK